MKRFLALVAFILGIVIPSFAMAGTPYTVNWAMVSEDPECVHARLFANGGGYVKVNSTPIPTYEVPGAFTDLANGWESNRAEAGFDSVLLRMGANGFALTAANTSGDDSCVRTSHFVTLTSPQLGIEKLLFDVRVDGTALSGSTTLDLSLEEINPQLAKDIAILETVLAAERKFLVENADKMSGLDERFDALQQLETELGDLLTRPLDEITAEELDEMLDKYSSVIDDATRQALQQVLADLKKDIVDLQTELASLMANFGDQADAVSDFLTGETRQNGFNPDDPSNYGLGPNDVPWVDVPDISGVSGAFDADKDPYAAYADGVIASLGENVSGGKVIERASFVALVRAWRSNQKALEAAMLARMSVSQAETNAFLNGQNKVTGYLQPFMNESGWFHDAPVPQDVRADVDGPLKHLYGALAEDLKDRLNAWEAAHNPPEASLFFDTLRAFSAGMEAGEEIAQQYRDTMRSIVHGASRVAIGFVPFVGPALDLCEAVTGKEWCKPSGRTLTTGERVFSGIGFGIGKVVKVWSGVKTAAISAEGKAVAAGVAALGPDVLEVLAKARISKWKTLSRASITATEALHRDFEQQVILHLIKDKQHKVLAMGKGVEDVLGIKINLQNGLSRSPDFLTVSPEGGLVISEAKFFKLGTQPVPVQAAMDQLENAMNRAVILDVAKDVERVQLVTTKGAKLADGVNPKDAKEIWTFTVKDGYLLKNGQKVTMPGKPDLFISVVEL